MQLGLVNQTVRTVVNGCQILIIDRYKTFQVRDVNCLLLRLQKYGTIMKVRTMVFSASKMSIRRLWDLEKLILCSGNFSPTFAL